MNRIPIFQWKHFALAFALLSHFSLIAQWTAVKTNLNEALSDLEFLPNGFGAVAGAKGALAITRDGGATWTARATKIKEDLHDVFLLGGDTIIVSAGTYFDNQLYRSNDAGKTWNAIQKGYQLENNQSRWLNFGYQAVTWSVDRGKSWQKTELQYGGTVLPERLLIPDGKTAYLIGNISGFASYSTFGFCSADGGLTWGGLFPFDFPNADAFTAIAAPDRDTVFVFSNQQVRYLPGPTNRLMRLQGFYYDATRGVESWRFSAEVVNTNLPTYMVDAAFLTTKQGWAAGKDGKIYQTNDSGKTWKSSFDGSTPLTRIFWPNTKNGWALGEGGLLLRFSGTTPTQEPKPNTLTLRAYPNPVKEVLQLESPQGVLVDLALFNLSGQLLQRFSFQGNYAMSLENLTPGLYLLEGRFANGRYSQLIQVQ